jgi:hypothetical protein
MDIRKNINSIKNRIGFNTGLLVVAILYTSIFLFKGNLLSQLPGTGLSPGWAGFSHRWMSPGLLMCGRGRAMARITFTSYYGNQLNPLSAASHIL